MRYKRHFYYLHNRDDKSDDYDWYNSSKYDAKKRH